MRARQSAFDQQPLRRQLNPHASAGDRGADSSAEIGCNYFQETHPQNLFRGCSVYCGLVSAPKQMPFVMESAIRAAVGERGVAVIVIPGDIALQLQPERAVSPVAGLLPPSPIVTPSQTELDALADILNSAPALVGILRDRHRCSRAERPLAAPHLRTVSRSSR